MFTLLQPRPALGLAASLALPPLLTAVTGRLLAICLEQVTKLMEKHKRRYKQQRMVDKAKMIYDTSVPRSTPKHIARRISTLSCSEKINPVKSFFQTGEAPMILHYVIHVQKGVKLIHQPLQLLPEIWRNFIHSLNPSEARKVVVTGNSNMAVKSATSVKNVVAPTKMNGQVSSASSSQGKIRLKNVSYQKSRSLVSFNTPGPASSVNFKRALTSVATTQSTSQKISSVKVQEKTIPKKITMESQAPSICKAMLSRVDLVPRPVKSSLKPTVKNNEEKEKPPSQNTPRVRFKLKNDLPKVRFTIKYGDNTLGNSKKTSPKRMLVNGISNHPKVSPLLDSSSEDKVCLQNGIDSDSSKTKSSGKSECTDNNVNKSNCIEHFAVMKSSSPTREILHSPKPPSTVKLKKSILKNKCTTQFEVPTNDCSLSCPELPTNSNDF